MFIAVLDLKGDQLGELEEFENKEEADEGDDAALFASLQPPFGFDQSGVERSESALNVPRSASPDSVDYSRASSELLLSEWDSR